MQNQTQVGVRVVDTIEEYIHARSQNRVVHCRYVRLSMTATLQMALLMVCVRSCHDNVTHVSCPAHAIVRQALHLGYRVVLSSSGGIAVNSTQLKMGLASQQDILWLRCTPRMNSHPQ